ncbi:MAG TPA: hypothetical protein VNH18_19105 [Bryobacteraceae bacterium]|nr:hypothetical protein [Bryobacteraceae bacterium]
MPSGFVPNVREMLRDGGNVGTQPVIEGRRKKPNEPVGGRANPVFLSLPLRDFGFVGMEVPAQLISVEAHVFSKKAELAPRQTSRAARDQRPRDRPMNLRHIWNRHIRVSTLRTVSDRDTLKDNIWKTTFRVSVVPVLRDHLFAAICALVR